MPRNKKFVLLTALSLALVTSVFFNFRLKNRSNKLKNTVVIKRDKKYYKNNYERLCCPEKNKRPTIQELSWIDCEGVANTVQCIDDQAARRNLEDPGSADPEKCKKATEEYLAFLKDELVSKSRPYSISSISQSKSPSNTAAKKISKTKRNRKVSTNSKQGKSKKLARKNGRFKPFKKRRGKLKANKKGRIQTISGKTSFNQDTMQNIEKETLKGLTCDGVSSVVNNRREVSNPNQTTRSESLLSCFHARAMKQFYDNQCVGIINPSLLHNAAQVYAEKHNECSIGFCFAPDNIVKVYNPDLNFLAPSYRNPLDKESDFGIIEMEEITPELFNESEDFYTKVPKVRLEIPESYMRHVFFNYGLRPHVDNLMETINDTISSEVDSNENLRNFLTDDVQALQENK